MEPFQRQGKVVPQGRTLDVRFPISLWLETLVNYLSSATGPGDLSPVSPPSPLERRQLLIPAVLAQAQLLFL